MTTIKKHKKGVGIIGLVVLFMVGVSLGIIPVMVSSENNPNGSPPEGYEEESEDTCSDETSTILSKLPESLEYSNGSIILSGYGSSFNINDYVFYLNGTVQTATIQGNDIVIENPSNITSSDNLLWVAAANSTDECYTYYSFSGDIEVHNTWHDSSICQNFLNNSANANVWAAVPACSEETVTLSRLEALNALGESGISNLINNAQRFLSYSNQELNVATPSGDNVIEVSDPSNTPGAQCDTFNTEIDNNKTYWHKENTTLAVGDGTCDVQCVETVEVIWDPPVATQIGMCFEYVAEIRTKMECDGTYTPNIPQAPPVCNVKPACHHGNKNYEQAGPNDDFDLCIEECDGGEYSQQCIDQCYQTVYENNTNISLNSNSGNLLTYQTKTLSASSSSGNNVTQVADYRNEIDRDSSDNQLIQYYANQVSSGSMSIDTAAQRLYQDYNNRYIDYVVNGNDTLTGQVSLNGYYFSSVSAVRNVLSKWLGERTFNSAYYYTYREAGGFLWQISRTLNGQQVGQQVCQDSCDWVGSCPANSVPNNDIALGVQQQLANKAMAAASSVDCVSQANLCYNDETVGTASFEITVDNPTETSDDYHVDYDASQQKGGTDVNGDDIVVETNGSCYGIEFPPYTYHNVLTFPKQYLNNKTHIITDKTPEDESIYTELGRKFCTRIDSNEVNVNWYIWDTYYDHDAGNYGLTSEEKQIIENEVNKNQNIHINIENYGYYNWNIPLTCFYALADPTDFGDNEKVCDANDENCQTNVEICDPETEDCDYDDSDCDPEKEDCDTNLPNDAYITRSISLANLFPSSEEGTSTRDPGFNWSCEATNLTIDGYPIQPVALRENIEKAGNSIYDEANEEKYLDYEFTLTPTTINAIRSYNKEQGSYLEPTADKDQVSSGNNTPNGIAFYKSSFINEMAERYGNDFLVKRGLIGCNNQSSSTQCDTAIYADSKYREACYDTYMAETGGK